MRLVAYALLAAILSVPLGCATTAKKAGVGVEDLPARAEGEVAVFGKVRLVEFVARTPMSSSEQEAAVYLDKSGSKDVYRLKCLDTGEFGAYLPVGEYTVTRVNVGGFVLRPAELYLVVPGGHDAAYAGTVVLDGTPTGVATGDTTRFIYTVRDEYRSFAAGLGRDDLSEARIVRSLFRPGSTFALGSYPDRVFRAKDLQDDLMARTGAVEEVFKGGFYALPYVINPLWILTLP